MPDDTPTPYEAQLRSAMKAAQKIANDDGPAADRLQALERHRAYVTRLMAQVKGE